MRSWAERRQKLMTETSIPLIQDLTIAYPVAWQRAFASYYYYRRKHLGNFERSAASYNIVFLKNFCEGNK